MLIPSKQYWFFSASVMLHVTLALFFVLHFQAIKNEKQGNAEREILSSYLVDVREIKSSTAAKEKPQPFQKSMPDAIALKKQTVQQTEQRTQKNQSRAAIKGSALPELTALLHAAIAHEQRYPASAQEMEREGRVTLAFTLQRDGSINEPQIVRSSGTDSLDAAAIAAVKRAAPFQQVDRYLKTAQPYQIDVVFELG